MAKASIFEKVEKKEMMIMKKKKLPMFQIYFSATVFGTIIGTILQIWIEKPIFDLSFCIWIFIVMLVIIIDIWYYKRARRLSV